MRRNIVALFLLLCICCVSLAQQRGVFVEETEMSPQTVGGDRYAVLIGVSDYEHLGRLRYTRNDIEALRDQLLDIGFDPSKVITIFCGGQTAPTKRNIETAISNTLNRAREGDAVIIAMSGHGFDIGGPKFCPPDTPPIDMLAAKVAESTVCIDSVYEKMGNSAATFKLLILDACRNDPFAGMISQDGSAVRTIPVSYAPPLSVESFKGIRIEQTFDADTVPGVIMLFSSSPGQLSWECNEIQRGIFIHYLVEGLKGAAANDRDDVTFLRLFDYASTATYHRAQERFNAVQRPFFKGEGSNFVLANVGNVPTFQPPMRERIRGITTLDLPQQPNELPQPSDFGRVVREVANGGELLRAIRELRDGGVIVLKPGTYNFNGGLDIVGSRTRDPIVLFGDPSEPEKVRIRTNARHGIHITRNVHLVGLDITNANTNGTGVNVEGEGEVALMFCRIHSCRGDGIFNSASIYVEGNVITGNGNGLQSGLGGRSNVNNSRIEHNRNNGVIVTRTSTGWFSDNILFDNGTNWRTPGQVQ